MPGDAISIGGITITMIVRKGKGSRSIRLSVRAPKHMKINRVKAPPVVC